MQALGISPVVSTLPANKKKEDSCKLSVNSLLKLMTEAVTEQTVANDAISHVIEDLGVPPEEGLNVEDDEDEEEDEDDDDDDEEAEEIARRLKEQLWADISKAQAAQASTSTETLTRVAAPTGEQTTSAPRTALSKKQDAALETIRSILAITANDALAHTSLLSAVVPGTNNDSVLNVLNRVVQSGSISKELAKSLTPTLLSLASSDILFATMRHSNAPAIQLDKGKRKRDESDEEQRQDDVRAFKRPNIVYPGFQRQITEAIQLVSAALNKTSPTNGSLDPSVISSIQLQLHQLFLFSVTSSTGGGLEMNALQEIGGLIQVLGVLSGIQIGPTAPQNPVLPQAPGSVLHPSHPWVLPGTNPHSSAPFNDIGTAVYPCLVPGCRKIFARLYSLRAHQRVHAVHRPFRCAVCPASFARNHDLKRHTKLHEKKAWQCAGCDKMFSRRDAIKRHKNSSAARGGKGEICVNAAIKEVVLDKEGEEEAVREGRRTRMWADIVTNSANSAVYHGHGDDGSMEEGEIHGDVIRQLQGAVLSLHATLQGHVSRALGTDQAAPPLHLDPTGGQATLASVIARAQMQNLAPHPPVQSLPVGDTGVSEHTEGPFSYSDDDVQAGSSLDFAADGGPRPESVAASQLSLYGLSEEQTKLLEQAIANAASAAQAQAEAEAALEEEDEEDEEDEEEHDSDEINDALSSAIAQASAASGP